MEKGVKIKIDCSVNGQKMSSNNGPIINEGKWADATSKILGPSGS